MQRKILTATYPRIRLQLLLLWVSQDVYARPLIRTQDNPGATGSVVGLCNAGRTMRRRPGGGHLFVSFHGARHTEASADREQGVRQAITTHQLQPPPNWLWEGAPESFTDTVLVDFLAQNVTAFVAEDDELGQRLLDIATQRGLACPADFSLAVLGNPLNPLIAPPNWTSFTIPRRQMGREAFALLLELLALPPEKRQQPLRRWLPCVFQPGETVRAV